MVSIKTTTLQKRHILNNTHVGSNESGFYVYRRQQQNYLRICKGRLEITTPIVLGAKPRCLSYFSICFDALRIKPYPDRINGAKLLILPTNMDEFQHFVLRAGGPCLT